MKMYVQLVVAVTTAALLQGCLTCRFDDPPVVTAEVEKTISDPVPAASPEPVSSPEPAPTSSVREPALNIVAETTQAPAGQLLVTGLNVEQNTIEILASGPIGNFTLITLSEPSRLVIDIPNAMSGFKQKNISIDKLGIAAARFENHTGYLRIYLDAVQWRIIPYRIEETGKSLKIIITAP